jgi:ElaB/YqjD/DUF883 family membrane-anchored ribosome-binding protein
MQGNPINRLERLWPPAPVADTGHEFEPDTGLVTRVKSWEKSLEEFMGEHPRLTIAAAAAVGVVLGWMVKRR